MALLPNVPNSVNPVEDSERDGSPAINGLQLSSPGSPLESTHMNASSETGTGTRTEPLNPLDNEDKEFFKEIRGWLMIVAILAAGSTYQAGLNPPGGVWQDDNKKHHAAGTPVLHDKFFHRYQAFFYCNVISFLSSLVIIIFLMNKKFYLDRKKIKVLEITMVLDLFSFMAAYAVGSCRRVTSSIYVFLLMGGVFVYVISFVRHYSLLHKIAKPFTRLFKRNTLQQQKLDRV